MGNLSITVGALTRTLTFDDTKGTETLVQFYDSLLSAGDDPEAPPADAAKLDAILVWIAQTVQTEAREHYKHQQKLAQQQAIEDEAETQFDMGAA